MPSKKPTKAAKKPGKATPGKAGQKAAVPKKTARPLPKHAPIATSKVPVKPNKPAPRPAAAKTAAKAPRPKPVPAKPPVLKPAAKPAAADQKSHDGAEMNDKHAPIK